MQEGCNSHTLFSTLNENHKNMHKCELIKLNCKNETLPLTQTTFDTSAQEKPLNEPLFLAMFSTVSKLLFLVCVFIFLL